MTSVDFVITLPLFVMMAVAILGLIKLVMEIFGIKNGVSAFLKGLGQLTEDPIMAAFIIGGIFAMVFNTFVLVICGT